MSKVVPFRKPLRQNDVYRIAELQDDSRPSRHLRIHVLTFTVIALLMYTVAVLSVPWETSDKLWLGWLVLVIAISKLALANGLFLGVTRADQQEQSMARETRLHHGTRSTKPLQEHPHLRLHRPRRPEPADR
jgi:hypothetical protein